MQVCSNQCLRVKFYPKYGFKIIYREKSSNILKNNRVIDSIQSSSTSTYSNLFESWSREIGCFTIGIKSLVHGNKYKNKSQEPCPWLALLICNIQFSVDYLIKSWPMMLGWDYHKDSNICRRIYMYIHRKSYPKKSQELQGHPKSCWYAKISNMCGFIFMDFGLWWNYNRDRGLHNTKQIFRTEGRVGYIDASTRCLSWPPEIIYRRVWSTG